MSMAGELLQEAKQEKLFCLLLKREENSICADCHAKAPTWVSLDFGVFVCMNCSGAHRHLSRSVTRVYSTKIDRWNTSNYQIMDYVGNKVANSYWEFKQPPRRIGFNAQPDERVRFVTEKYVRKLHCNPKEQNPVITFVKNRELGVLKRPISTNEDTLPPPNIQFEGEKVFISNGAATNQHVIQIRKEQQEMGKKEFNSVNSPQTKPMTDLLDLDDNCALDNDNTFQDFVSAPQVAVNKPAQNTAQQQPSINLNGTSILDLYNNKQNPPVNNTNSNQNTNGSNLNALYSNNNTHYQKSQYANYANNTNNQNTQNGYQFNNTNNTQNSKPVSPYGSSPSMGISPNGQGNNTSQTANTNVDLMSLYNKSNSNQNSTASTPTVYQQQQVQNQVTNNNNDIVVDKNRYQALNQMNQMGGQFGNYYAYQNPQFQNYNNNQYHLNQQRK